MSFKKSCVPNSNASRKPLPNFAHSVKLQQQYDFKNAPVKEEEEDYILDTIMADINKQAEKKIEASEKLERHRYLERDDSDEELSYQRATNSSSVATNSGDYKIAVVKEEEEDYSLDTFIARINKQADNGIEDHGGHKKDKALTKDMENVGRKDRNKLGRTDIDVEDMQELHLRDNRTGINKEQRLALAEKLLHKGSQLKAVAETCSLNRSTITQHLKGKHKSFKRGPAAEISAEVEEHLFDYLQKLTAIGLRLTLYDFRKLIKLFLDQRGIKSDKFTDNLPGLKWIKLFRERHPNRALPSLHRPTLNRIQQINENSAYKWYQSLESHLDQLSIKYNPENIYVCDEIGLSMDCGVEKIFCHREMNDMYQFTPKKNNNNNNNNTEDVSSVLFTVSADGTCLPPFVILKNPLSEVEFSENWRKKGPEGVVFDTSASGWMCEENLFTFFAQSFLPFVRLNRDNKLPHLLIMWSHVLHFSERVVSAAREENVHLLTLLPHSSHIFQPLDVSCYGLLKVKWREQIKQFSLKNGIRTIRKQDFGLILRDTLLNDGIPSENIKVGFEKTGIYPFDPTKAKNSGQLAIGNDRRFITAKKLKRTSTNKKSRNMKIPAKAGIPNANETDSKGTRRRGRPRKTENSTDIFCRSIQEMINRNVTMNDFT